MTKIDKNIAIGLLKLESAQIIKDKHFNKDNIKGQNDNLRHIIENNSGTKIYESINYIITDNEHIISSGIPSPNDNNFKYIKLHIFNDLKLNYMILGKLTWLEDDEEESIILHGIYDPNTDSVTMNEPNALNNNDKNMSIKILKSTNTLNEKYYFDTNHNGLIIFITVTHTDGNTLIDFVGAFT